LDRPPLPTNCVFEMRYFVVRKRRFILVQAIPVRSILLRRGGDVRSMEMERRRCAVPSPPLLLRRGLCKAADMSESTGEADAESRGAGDTRAGDT
jgi:hypothetical protein